MRTHWSLRGRASAVPLSDEGPPGPEGKRASLHHFECSGGASEHSLLAGIWVASQGRMDMRESLRLQVGSAGTASTPDLVRKAYQKWGSAEFASHLIGDFAAVLWDVPQQRLVLTRSPSGHYPLCYSKRDGELLFGNTPHAILAGNVSSPAPDERAFAEWLVLRPRLSDRTFFTGIRRVPPGHTLVYEHDRVTLHRDWRPESLGTLRLRDHREYADAVREALQAAVADRLRDEQGNIAAQLSGGLDSSSVVALAAESLAGSGRKVLAFTAVPGSSFRDPVPNRFFDESDHAAAVAAQYDNVVHTRVTTEERPLFEVLDRHADAEAAPPFNPHHLQWIDGTYAAAALAGATTLLTGSMGNTTISAAGSLATVDALQHGHFLQAAKLFAESRASGAQRLRHVPGTVLTALAPRLMDAGDSLRRMRTGLEEFTGVRTRFAVDHGIDPERWNRRLPFRTVREQMLDAVDRFDFGMFHEAPRHLYGLNATDPTYDRRVVELTLQIPLEQFCHGGVPRALIRNAMKGRLPDVVRLERRRGLQSADFLNMLQRERSAIAEELERMREVDLVCRAIDVPLLQQRLQWTTQQAIAYGWHPYSNRLMRAVSAGRFLRRLADGSLFTTTPAVKQDLPDSFTIQL